MPVEAQARGWYDATVVEPVERDERLTGEVPG